MTGKKKPRPLRNIGCTVLIGILLTCGALMFLPEPDSPDSPAQTSDPVTAAIASIYGRNRANQIETNTITETTVTVRFPFTSLSKSAVRSEINRFPEVLCALRENGITGRDVYLHGTIVIIDTLGNESVTDGANALFKAETVDAINCENAGFVDTQAIAETYTVHPALRE